MRRASSTLVLGTTQKLKAHVVKLVNTLHSGCSELKLLEVRVFSWAQAIRLTKTGFFCLYTMRILYLNTDQRDIEIENLITDIISNSKSHDIQIFRSQITDFRWYELYKIVKARSFIKKNKIDIIHTYRYSDAYLALLLSFGLNVKVVFSCYSYYEDLKGFSNYMYKTAIAKCAAVIFQTETQKKRFISKYKDNHLKYFKLFHGFSSVRLDNYKYESIRDEFFIDDYRYLIGTLCDFSPEHDVMNILKMVKKLRKSGRDFTCLISGDIDDEYDTYFDDCKYYYLIQGLDNYITYMKRRDDAPNYLSQLDAFVYHSDDEAVALPVIEAMVMGVNVVANDSEMIKEITCDGKYATLYKTKDAVDFAEKTRGVLLELDDYRIIAETIKEEARMLYSIEKHIAGLEKIYRIIKNN